jgi:TPR repeat protein
MSFVGDNFCRGRGVSLSKEMARLWYEKAAEQGCAQGQWNLATMHGLGMGGLPVSKEKARLLYEKAAEQGHGGAQCMLARMHLYGEGGLPVSKEKARLLYEKAAEQGLHQGQHNREEKALLWLKRAAEQGYEDATTLIDTDFKNKCFSCGKTGAMKCCSRCKCAYYCSQECQAAAWKSGHKATCKQIRRMQKTKK